KTHQIYFTASCSAATLNDLLFPLAAFEQQSSDDRKQRGRDGDRPEYALRAHSEPVREQICQRYLKHPKDEEVEIRRRYRVPRAVERTFHHHPEPIKRVPVADNSKAIAAIADDLLIGGEDIDHRLGKDDEDHPECPQQNGIDAAGDPDSAFGPFWFARTQIL